MKTKVAPLHSCYTEELFTSTAVANLSNILVNEGDIEPTVIKNPDHFIFAVFVGFQLLDLLSCLDGAKSFDSFLDS